MQRSKTFSRANLLGIFFLGIGSLLLLRNASSSASELTFLKEWWKQGQANFWQSMASSRSTSADSLALDHLISWRAHPDALSLSEISELSPFILSKSFEYRVSPVLVLSLIEVESNFQPAAVSQRGAIGLMQLMPETAEQIARAHGMEWNGPSVLVDPKMNIEFGLRYMAYLKQNFEDPAHILAAYNIGPNAVKRKIETGQKVPHEYYDRVMGTVKAYQKRARRNQLRPGLWVNSWL